MSRYHFYYDESEHSRKINYNTISAENYYDNFVAVIIGFPEDHEKIIYKKYADFEEKYRFRMSQGELKSQTLKQSQFKNGFASMNTENIKFVDEFLSVFDDDFIVYFAVESKVEFIINQVFEGYQNSLLFDMDAMKYTIVKSIMKYRPKEILEAIFENTGQLLSALKKFFKEKIEINESNFELKQREIGAYKEVLIVLEDIGEIKTIEWNYDIAFWGFKQYINERSINDYDLTIDEEGLDEKTLQAAKRVGLIQVMEIDSKNSVGVRISDMLAGIISKLLKAVCTELQYKTLQEQVEKKLLGKEWFNLNQSQLNLYKKLCALLCKKNEWYKFLSGRYADDLVTVISLLEYMNNFNLVSDINQIEMRGEYFNTFLCDNLDGYFDRMRNKLPIDFVHLNENGCFLNQQGAKVFIDSEKQPLLKFVNGSCKCKVLSVGCSRESIPLITIKETSGEINCYRLPDNYLEWAMTVVGFANSGVNVFPSEVIFTEEDGEYYADIL